MAGTISGAGIIAPTAGDVAGVTTAAPESDPRIPMRLLLFYPTMIERMAMCHLLEQRQFEVDQAGDAVAAVRLVERDRPRFAVLDLEMSLTAARQMVRRFSLACPETWLVGLTVAPDRGSARQLLKDGLAACVLKHGPFEHLVAAIDASDQRTAYLSPLLSAPEDDEEESAPLRQERSRNLTALSPRERQVLQMLADGLSSKQIAASIGLSVKTVENHRLHITGKLDIRSIAALTKFAIREGLISVKKDGSEGASPPAGPAS